MHKKKKNTKNKGFNKSQLESLILTTFKENPIKTFNYKQLSKKLKIKELKSGKLNLMLSRKKKKTK